MSNYIAVRKHFKQEQWEEKLKASWKYLGVIKDCHAVFVIKDLLGDDSAASSQNEVEMLDRLNITIESGEDIIVDIQRNNGKKTQIWKFLGHIKLSEISHAFNRPD